MTSLLYIGAPLRSRRTPDNYLGFQYSGIAPACREIRRIVSPVDSILHDDDMALSRRSASVDDETVSAMRTTANFGGPTERSEEPLSDLTDAAGHKIPLSFLPPNMREASGSSAQGRSTRRNNVVSERASTAQTGAIDRFASVTRQPLSPSFLAELDKPQCSNLDILPETARQKRYQWYTGLEDEDTNFHPKLPRGVKKPTAWDDKLDYGKIRDLETQPPWQPAPLFDNRLIEAHLDHAANYYRDVERSLFFANGGVASPGPLENNWRHEQMAGRLHPDFLKKLNKSLVRIEPSAQGDDRSTTLSAPSAQTLSTDSSPTTSGEEEGDGFAIVVPPGSAAEPDRNSFEADMSVRDAKERMRRMLQHAEESGFDASLEPRAELPNPVSAIFNEPDRPIGFASRDELDYHCLRTYEAMTEAQLRNGKTPADITAFEASGSLSPDLEARGQRAKEALVADHRLFPVRPKRSEASSRSAKNKGSDAVTPSLPPKPLPTTPPSTATRRNTQPPPAPEPVKDEASEEVAHGTRRSGRTKRIPSRFQEHFNVSRPSPALSTAVNVPDKGVKHSAGVKRSRSVDKQHIPRSYKSSPPPTTSTNIQKLYNHPPTQALHMDPPRECADCAALGDRICLIHGEPALLPKSLGPLRRNSQSTDPLASNTFYTKAGSGIKRPRSNSDDNNKADTSLQEPQGLSEKKQAGHSRNSSQSTSTLLALESSASGTADDGKQPRSNSGSEGMLHQEPQDSEGQAGHSRNSESTSTMASESPSSGIEGGVKRARSESSETMSSGTEC